jgi:hypothetical protein
LEGITEGSTHWAVIDVTVAKSSKPSRQLLIEYQLSQSPGKVFYALDLPWQKKNELSTDIQQIVNQNPRILWPSVSNSASDYTIYELAASQKSPRLLYLIAATQKIDALERVNAEIEPAKYLKLRGPFIGSLPSEGVKPLTCQFPESIELCVYRLP